jgi:hypothetical protein
MKLRGQTQRRKRRIRKAAFFSFVGSLVLTGFITPPIVQAPQGYHPSLSMQETPSQPYVHPEKPKIQLSRDKTPEETAKQEVQRSQKKPKKEKATPNTLAQKPAHTLAQSEPQLAKQADSTSHIQQNWSQARQEHSKRDKREPGVTSISPDKNEEEKTNQPEKQKDEQTRETKDESSNEPEQEEERSSEDESGNESADTDPTSKSEADQSTDSGEGTESNGNHDATDGDESDGDDRDKRNREWNNRLQDWLTIIEES